MIGRSFAAGSLTPLVYRCDLEPFELSQIEFLHLIAQGIAGDAQQARGLGLVAGGFFERLD